MTAKLFGLNEVIGFPNTSPQNLCIPKFFSKEILFLNSGTGSLPVSFARLAKLKWSLLIFYLIISKFFLFIEKISRPKQTTISFKNNSIFHF